MKQTDPLSGQKSNFQGTCVDFTSDPGIFLAKNRPDMEVRTIIFENSQVQSGQICGTSGQKIPFQDQVSPTITRGPVQKLTYGILWWWPLDHNL